MRIQFVSATKRYWGNTALESIDLVVEPGSLVAVLGVNGAGKSTLVGRLMSGRQMQIIALLDMLKNQAAFPVRMRKFVFLQLFCLAFAGVVAATLSWLIPLQFLVPMIALFPAIRYLANLYGHDSGLVAILGAALLMAVSYGISSLLIAAYLSSQVDHL